MNILFLSRDYPPEQIGGVGIYVYEASRLLAKMGHKVFVITGAIGHTIEYLDQGVCVYRVRPRRFAFLNPIRHKIQGFFDRLEYSYAVSQKIKEVVSRHKIDVIESCEARAEGFWYYFLHNHPPLVIKLHTPEGLVYKLNRDPENKERYLIEKLEEWWLRRAHKLVGLSNAVIKLTQGYYGIEQKQIPIVANPISADFLRVPVCSVNKGYILYVGRLEYRKGTHVLIRAIPGILKKFPRTKFVFIGSDCGMKNYLLDKVNEFGVNENVEFIGQLPREELIPYYHESSFCIVPSLWENHPYVILEAMACGKPVIASNVGGIPEIIKDKINGRLIPPGSVSGLTDAAIELLGDAKMRENLGGNAKKYVEEQYAPQKVMQKIEKIYSELIK